jgi:hypothetical protein
MKKIFNYKFDKYIFFVIILAFCLYNFNNLFVWLPNFKIFGHLIFNWPDSNANYFFSQLFAQTFHFFHFEPLNLLTDNLLHTRSINVLNANLVPMTWLWPLLVFALFSKVFSSLGLLFLTPILAATAIFLFYRLVSLVFASDFLGFISAVLLAFLAPWLFFANEVMLPNIMFITSLLAALYFFSKNTDKTFIIFSLLFLSTVMMRPNELVWLLFLLGFLFFYCKSFFDKKRIIIFFILTVLAAAFSLLLNKLTYGNYLAFGYLNFQANTLPTEFAQANFSLLKFWQFLILPFVWETKIFFSNIYHYLFLLIWPYYIFGLFGIIPIFKNNLTASKINKKIWLRYLLVVLFLSLVILIYYANWNLADPLVKTYNTISISFVRYFLPIYILLIPLVALGIVFLTDLLTLKFKVNVKFKFILVLFFILILSIFSFRLAFFAPHDGLLKTRENIINYYQQFQAVKLIVPSSAVLMTDRSDKIFFSYYSVIVPQGDLPLWPRIAKLRTAREVFYFTDKTDEQILAINKEASLESLELVPISSIDENFRLFIIISIK